MAFCWPISRPHTANAQQEAILDRNRGLHSCRRACPPSGGAYVTYRSRGGSIPSHRLGRDADLFLGRLGIRFDLLRVDVHLDALLSGIRVVRSRDMEPVQVKPQAERGRHQHQQEKQHFLHDSHP